MKFFIFSQDSLTIYDGDSNTSPMLGIQYCGDSLPPLQISSSNFLFIHFQSNYRYTGTGFKLQYNPTSKNPYKIPFSRHSKPWLAYFLPHFSLRFIL